MQFIVMLYYNAIKYQEPGLYQYQALYDTKMYQQVMCYTM